MKTTTNLQLPQFEASDYFDIAPYNEAYEKIDEEIATLKQETEKIDEEIITLKEKTEKITGVVRVPTKTIIGWSNTNHVFTVEGIRSEDGYVIKMTPSSALEGGVNYCCLINGINSATLRIFAGEVTTTIFEQDWYYVIEKVF